MAIAIFFSVIAVCVTLYKITELRFEYELRMKRENFDRIYRITSDPDDEVIEG